MTMIVGYAPDERGKAALHLAGMLARSAADDLVVCSVVPAPWLPSMARVDSEYQEFLDESADQALEQARANMPEALSVNYLRYRARSAPAGLLEVAESQQANLIVLGSSSAGVFGHVALGSVTDRLLHSSPISIALATRGFRCKPDTRVVRVTAAFGGAGSVENLVVAAASVAARVGATLRIASFAVWSRPAYTTRLGTDSEDLVWDEWKANIEETSRKALEQVATLRSAPRELTAVIGRGEGWTQAMDDIEWDEGDVLVVGSSDIGPVAQVFIGSRASKILRHSPVPVVVVPRGRQAQLVDQAANG